MTTLKKHFGSYWYIFKSFELKSAPINYQQGINIILARVMWQYALMYLDDIIIFSKSFDERLYHIASILKLLQDAGITLQLQMLCFLQMKVDYLGHVT